MAEVKTYLLGIDIGSTTVKCSVINSDTKEIIFSKYERHNAKQPETLLEILKEIKAKFPDERFRAAVCGSGGGFISQYIDAFFIQEVVANAIAVKEYYDKARVAIELGGQDAKIIFFHHDEETGSIMASDMRMNGSCAGGTGAFIDQIAELLNIKTEEFGELAKKGSTVYDISGRCGVFAKTDIQPLLNQGVPREDIALSTFHAIAKQTIGGLAQGAEIHPPVIFEGGPLTFNTKLIDVFAERLSLSKEQVIVPDNPEIIVAIGAALSLNIMFDREKYFDIENAISKLEVYRDNFVVEDVFELNKFFSDSTDSNAFFERHKTEQFSRKRYKKGETVEVYLGIDAGSTTSKFVLIDNKGAVVDKFYANNVGEPLNVVQKAMIEMRDRYIADGVKLKIKAVGTTGYGEVLFAKAFKADYHTVETVSHAEAAMKYVPDVSFIMDIGGQDMKAINIKDGIVTGIVLNEACSAGCGSFIETYAKSLKIPVDKIAEMAFNAEKPSRLGSRCTVFMNSCIVTEQRNGKTPEDIMAGLCRSVIDNVFTKVVRVPNFNMLGNTIMVQGGTFKNNAVLRAMEQYTGRKVVRPPHPGEMGAIGIALLTKKHIEELEAKNGEYKSKFIGLDSLENFTYEKNPGNICKFCTNNCNRTVVKFGDGTSYVTGNRCERGEIIGDVKDETVRKQLKETIAKLNEVPDMMEFRQKLLVKDYAPAIVSHKKNIRIGIPRVLEFWSSYPFWNAFFTSLGFEVVLSDESSYKIFEDGLQFVPSDTVCFPAKLVHGHIKNLVEKKVDRIFFPMMMEIPSEHKTAKEAFNMCAVIQGYPVIIRENDEPEKRYGVIMDSPIFRWYNTRLRNKQLLDFINEKFGLHKDVVNDAVKEGDKAYNAFISEMESEGSKIIKSLEENNSFAVILAGRPYHNDELVNHGLSAHFTRLGIPVLTLDSIPGLFDTDLSGVRADTVNPFHTRLFGAAIYAAKHPNLEITQIVSFGCGHDAINTDEMTRLMGEISDKQLLVLKLDEGEAKGPLGIRVKSFVETIIAKRKQEKEFTAKELPDAFETKFLAKDRKTRTIFIPNLSESFSHVTSAVLRTSGLSVKPLPVADTKAKELGKKYVHNDICYPAQINIGEILGVLESGQYTKDEVALGLAKNCDGCRAGQYMMLGRRALDEAGYSDVPIVTTGKDNKGAHPGFNVGLRFQLGMLVGLTIVDAMEEMRRKIRPYEMNSGETEKVFFDYLDKLCIALERGYKKAFKVLDEAINAFNNIEIVNGGSKPKVFIIGEILLNYHRAANEEIVDYFEKNGMETILPTFVDFFRRDVIRIKEGVRKNHIASPMVNFLLADITDKGYKAVLDRIDNRMKNFKFFEKKKDVHELADTIENLIDKTYTSGEGWLIPAEIMENASHGVNAFVIVQPFGCLPNHITGRGFMKAIKKKYPHIQIVSIDYDPDTSFANVENRLQMLIMAAKERESAN